MIAGVLVCMACARKRRLARNGPIKRWLLTWIHAAWCGNRP